MVKVTAMVLTNSGVVKVTLPSVTIEVGKMVSLVTLPILTCAAMGEVEGNGRSRQWVPVNQAIEGVEVFKKFSGNSFNVL